MFFNPLVLGGFVRKDCVVGRAEGSQESRLNGVGVWLSSGFMGVVTRDVDSAHQPLSYIVVEYLNIRIFIWEGRIMPIRFGPIFVGSHQAW